LCALYLAVALVHGGCALTLSGPDPKRSRDRVPRCDTTKGLVVADALMGSSLGLLSLVALGEDAGTAALVPASIGALFILSAVRGNGAVNDCRVAITEYEEGETRAAALAEDEDEDEDEDETRVRAPVRRRTPAGVGPAAGTPPRGVRTPPAGAAPAPARGVPPVVAPPVAAPPAPAPAAPPVAAPPVAAPPAPAPAAPPVAAPPAPAPAAPPVAAPPARPAPAAPPAKAPPLAPPPPSTWVDFWRELP
jgi:hypothetical protein